MSHALTNDQLMALLQNSPALDRVMPSLPSSLQQSLLDLQVRAGNAYAGMGQGDAPTREEAQAALGQAYLALQDQQTTLKNVMNEMWLTPSAQSKNWVQQVTDTVTGWFR